MFGIRSLSVTRQLSKTLFNDASKVTRIHAMRFHAASRCYASKPFYLADIGEGITECQIIQWFVKAGDRVQEFDPICEVQSDKASVEITSRFEGKISELLYKVDDMAKVGQPLVYIETDDIPSDSQEQLQNDPVAPEEGQNIDPQGALEGTKNEVPSSNEPAPVVYSQTKSHLATPAVRHILKVNGIDIANVQGTGKDGRVLKDDVQRYISSAAASPSRIDTVSPTNETETGEHRSQDKIVNLTPMQMKMFQSMTKSLTIPHFLFSHSVDFTSLNSLRKRVKSNTSLSTLMHNSPTTADTPSRLTTLSFIVKVLSYAFQQFPTLNAHLDTETDSDRPQLIVKARHNFGIAIDTPNGLVVPVIKDVQELSIVQIAAELQRLGSLAVEGRLSPSDFGEATFTISNMGSIGGGVLSPVIVPPMVGILAIGRAGPTPVFEKGGDGEERIVKREQGVLSWAADHRVLDGATVAKCASVVETLLKDADCLVAVLR